MNYIPLISATFFLATVASFFFRKKTRGLQGAIFIVVFLMALIPIEDISVASYVTIVAGDLSPISLALLTLFLFQNLTGRKLPGTFDEEVARLQIIISVVAIILYPTALGFSAMDIYSHGYYPLVLTPLIVAIFGLSIYRGWYYLGGLIILSWFCYQTGLLSSDNLWDYLMDPLLAIWCLFNFKKAWRWPNPEVGREGLLFLVGAFLIFSVIHAKVNPSAFTLYYIKEDGFIEYATFFALIIGLLVCIRRLINIRGRRETRFICTTTILTVFCLFGAGEEISWGQRIFEIESPNFFLAHNKQQETGLHNLVLELEGKEFSVNKIIFGTSLAFGLCIYLFVMTPLYRSKPLVASSFDRLGIPMPRNYHILGYLLIVLIVELMIDSSRRGEVTEFTGVIIFLLNIMHPYNAHIYDKKIDLNQIELSSSNGKTTGRLDLNKNDH